MRRFHPDPSRYEIEQDRGEGLSATVCKAIRIDPRENVRQIVALKFPKDGTKIADLRQEFEALSRVGSKHCARALAWESAGSQNVLVLEWIEGPTLFELAATCSLSTEVQNEIVFQIHQGLLDLHRVGLHHGDLHPGNIMIGVDGIVRLIDFSSRTGGENAQFGVPAFLAPEVREQRETSFESDLFALGVLCRGMEFGFKNLAKEAPCSEMGLCAAFPGDRKFDLELEANERRQQDLRHVVEDYLSTKYLARTQVLSGQSRSSAIELKWIRFCKRAYAKRLSAQAVFFIFGLVFLSAVSAPVKAEAPLLKSASNAKLVVSTLQWAELSLNGKKVGYAPIEISTLSPGIHRLSWSSAFGAGSLVLELSSGELKLVDERVLRAHSKTVKH